MAVDPMYSNHDSTEMPPLPGTMKRQRSRNSSQLESQKKSKRCQEDLISRLQSSGASNFLQKTYLMISTCNPMLASWSEDGTKIIIKDSKKFEKDELKNYFQHSKFSSFSRQLNFYGFKKSSSRSSLISSRVSKGQIIFQNLLFVRDRIELLKQIKRSTNHGNANTSLSQNQEQVQAFHSQEVNNLKTKVADLESSNGHLQTQLTTMTNDFAALQNQITLILDNLKYSSIANGHLNFPINSENQKSSTASFPPIPPQPNARSTSFSNMLISLAPLESLGDDVRQRSVLAEYFSGRSVSKEALEALNSADLKEVKSTFGSSNGYDGADVHEPTKL